MANQEHLDILKQGVEVWNKWRKDNPRIRPDLTLANLFGMRLSGVDFTGARLSRASLSHANLSLANLFDAKLDGVSLDEANLTRTNFIGTLLFRANLSEASLNMTNFSMMDLIKVNFSNATVIYASFGDVDLSMAKGLDTVKHVAPSTIGIDTIYRSKGMIPDAFLRGAGVPDVFIAYAHSLANNLNEYYTCFISHSNKDDAFARRLYAALQNSNVRCWFAPEDLKWGALTRTGIEEAIHAHDKLLLILSKHSVASGWVEREVKTALAREKKEKRVVLFPVRVDNAVFDCPYAWATDLQHERNIGDFTRWKNHDEYQIAFERLLRDLHM